jgi:hypothetical protein
MEILSFSLSNKEKEEIVKQFQSRYKDSYNYYQDKFDTFIRCYKIYKAIADYVDDPDEENIFIPYAYGLIEDIVSRSTDPILDKLPIIARAKRKEYQKNADNFLNLFLTYWTSPEHVEQLIKSEREKVITGSAWEKDEWVSEWVDGYEWVETTETKIIEKTVNFLNKIINTNIEVPFKKYVEQKKKYPKKVGYITTFPSIFTVFPEPRVTKIEDMKWVIQIEDNVSIEDLQNAMYVDSEGNFKPIYNLEELLKDFDNKPENVKPSFFDTRTSYYDMFINISNGQAEQKQTYDKDYNKGKVHLAHMYEPNRIVTIANGKYVIKVIKDPFHIPKIPFRLKTYTQDNSSIYGIGAIEPIEHLLYELNDIHRLSMRSWIRIINGLVVYHKDAVPFPDDWKPKAGGRVRIDPGISPNIHNAIASIPLQDPSQQMILHESNIKGLIERTTSIVDFSAGVKGTKQYHKTATGLLELQNNIAKRFSISRKLMLTNIVKRLQTAYELCVQFLFEPVVARISLPNGNTMYPELTREDIIVTGGIDFIITNDPSLGDDTIKRNQLMVLLELFMKYEAFRIKTGDASMMKAKVSDLFKKVIEAFGWSYPEELLETPDNTLTPDVEFELILNGQEVNPNPKENLVNHITEHLTQLHSNRLKELVLRNKIDNNIIKMLENHIEETIQLLQEIAQNPMALAQDKIIDEIKKQAMIKKDIQYEKENIMPTPKKNVKADQVSRSLG